MPLRIGTRASALARWQAEWVAARLRQWGTEVELVPIATAGDRPSGAVDAIGSQGVFTKEIQHALLEGRIDLAVHSLKDLPTTAIEGLTLAAVPERGPSGDVLVSASGARLDELPDGALIGTGSPRRRAQLLHFRSELIIDNVRGNVETRLRKLRHGDFDALVLAEAGLVRLGLAEQITQKLPENIMLPAPGQGALGLETRTEDAPTRRLVAALDHSETHAAVSAERTMLLALQGGCLVPVAALGRVEDGRLRTGRETTGGLSQFSSDENGTVPFPIATVIDLPVLTLVGRVLGRDGLRMLESTDSAPPTEAEALGRRVAEALSAQGAGELIRAARETE